MLCTLMLVLQLSLQLSDGATSLIEAVLQLLKLESDINEATVSVNHACWNSAVCTHLQCINSTAYRLLHHITCR